MPATNGALAPAPDLSIPQKMMQSWTGRTTPMGAPIPKSAIPVFSLGTATPTAYAPAAGSSVLLVTYQVKANYYFLGCGVVLQFAGTGPAPNPGDVSFIIDIDRPLGNTTAGYVEKDYGNIPVTLGSFQQPPPWPVEFRHSNGEVIRIKGTAVANMGIGAGNFLLGALIGFEWPAEGWEG